MVRSSSPSASIYWQEAALYLLVVVYTLPNTFISRSIAFLSGVDLFSLLSGASPVQLEATTQIGLYAAGAVAFITSSCLCRTHPLSRCVAVLGGLFLWDFFSSSAEPYNFRTTSFVFFALLSFNMATQITKRDALLRTVLFMSTATSLQAAYAVVYYLLGIDQFLDPAFGERTGGTFAQPVFLYPLCVFGLCNSIALQDSQVTARARALLTVGAVVNSMALFLTFTRTAWLGSAVSLMYLAVVQDWKRRIPSRVWPVTCACAALIIASLFVRTRGALILDRSTLGRIEIWRTGVSIFAKHPVIGSGFATYAHVQGTFMTPALAEFNPLNQEAKCLPLNFVIEFGIVGMLTLTCLAISYLRILHAVSRTMLNGTSDHAIVSGTNAFLVGMGVASLFDTPFFSLGRASSTFVLFLALGIVTALATVDGTFVPAYRSLLIRMNTRVFRVVILLMTLTGMWKVSVACAHAIQLFPAVDALSQSKLPSGSSISLAEIPLVVQHAVIASEDRGFYRHAGLDWSAMHRALRKNMRAMRIRQGGSTITQQLVKNLFITQSRTFSRKMTEAILAVRLEQRLTKDRILELYLNTVDFGLGSTGIETAAQTYFGKNAKRLSLSEAAMLAGLLPDPPEHKLTVSQMQLARLKVLDRVAACLSETYSPQELQDARSRKLVVRPGLLR